MSRIAQKHTAGCYIIIVIQILILSFIWSFIFLSFTLFVNSNAAPFYLIRSWLTLIEVIGVSVELCAWSIHFWNLWWSSSISNNSPTTSLFSLLHTFVSFTLFLVCLLSLTVQVDTRRRFNVYKTSIRRRRHRIDVL